MTKIFGTLSRQDLYSFLMPEGNWLLMDGFPDPAQAGDAATSYIDHVRHLPNNSPVMVTGTASTIRTQPVIVMSDIESAPSAAPEAMARIRAPRAITKKVQSLRTSPIGPKKRSGSPPTKLSNS